jgi:hypothetical protein
MISQEPNIDFANIVQFDAKFPLHDVDTSHGRRFGARQAWRFWRIISNSICRFPT